MSVASERVAEVERRTRAGLDVTPDDVADLLAAPETVLLARRALAESALRVAADRIGDLAAAQDYSDQATFDLLARLAPLAQNEYPYVVALRAIGLKQAAAGRYDDALATMEMMALRGGTIGQRSDARSRRAMAFLADRETDLAIGQIAAAVFPPPPSRPFEPPVRVAFIVSAITDDNSGTRVAVAIARSLAQRSLSVAFVATGHAGGPSLTATELAREFPVTIVPAGGGHLARARAVRDAVAAGGAQIALYLTFPSDAVAKVVMSAGAAPRQVFLNTSYEPHTGRFDAVLQTVAEAQNDVSLHRAVSRFVGTGLVSEAAIDAAIPLDRGALGVTAATPLFGTFGRLQKCTEPGYLAATAELLAREPQAVLLLAGPAYDAEVETISRTYRERGVIERVRFLGPQERAVPSLLKTLDVYLDSFPFPGAQSVLEAMRAGVPVVAMRTVVDTTLDPSGTGPTTATAEIFAGDGSLVAAGDVDAYVALAQTLLGDPTRRAAESARVARRAREQFGWSRFIDRLERALLETLVA